MARSAMRERGLRLAREQRGQALVEFALALVPFLLALLGAVQFALVSHARDVVETAAVEGARVAAAEGQTTADGKARAEATLRSYLGAGYAARFSVNAFDQGETVRVTVQGRYPLIWPLLPQMPPIGRSVNLRAEAVMRKEFFRPGP